MNKIVNLHRLLLLLLAIVCYQHNSFSQNSISGDGFGGRSWYTQHNYQVGALSGYSVCGSNNQLYAWGNFAEYGLLPSGYFIGSDTAIAIAGMTNVKYHTAGANCAAIKFDSTAWLWGDSSYKYAGTIPRQIATNVKFIDAGYSHVALVKYDGTVWAMGVNGMGQLGNGSILPFFTPSYLVQTTLTQMVGINNAVRVVTAGGDINRSASIILLADSTLKETGSFFYALSDPYDSVPKAFYPSLLRHIVDIKANDGMAYALNDSGQVYSWGYDNGTGASGYNNCFCLFPLFPTKITFPSAAAPIVAISTNNPGFHVLALDENGNVYGWGNNPYGELGGGTPVHLNTPVLVATNAIDIYAGGSFSYILKADCSLWATGVSFPNYQGSVWMNLPDTQRNVFTQINPIGSPMHLCQATNCNLSPIKLLNFKCVAHNEIAVLKWQSSVEENFDKYIIEYSEKNNNFQSVGFIISKGSYSSYVYEHKPTGNKAFYRLKMMDKDGSYKYSEIRSLQLGNVEHLVVSPNPAKDYVYIHNSGIKSLKILSIDGTLLKIINNYSDGQRIDIHDLPAGTFLLKTVDIQGMVQYKKIVKSL